MPWARSISLRKSSKDASIVLLEFLRLCSSLTDTPKLTWVRPAARALSTPRPFKASPTKGHAFFTGIIPHAIHHPGIVSHLRHGLGIHKGRYLDSF